MDANEWISLLISRAAELRDAGVLNVSAEGCSATLAAGEDDTIAESEPDTGRHHVSDPLMDPSTFPGGRMPGFPELHRAERERE